MAKQFLRKYSLVITGSSGIVRTIEELRISFEITKSILSFPNIAKISIYNVNSETLALLQDRFTKIILNAGYEFNTKMIFSGEIRNTFQSKKDVDRITTVYAADGQKDWENSIFNGTFSEDISNRSIINKVIETFKETSVGIIKGISNSNTDLLGESLSGSSATIMDTLSEKLGVNWSIQDNEINVIPLDESLDQNNIVVVNGVTGMIGSPTITEIGADVTTLLNPDLLPERAFEIQSINTEVAIGNLFFRELPRTTAAGFYKVQEVIFRGDSRDGEWLSSVKGRTLNV